jgi:hypothetical protein
LSQWRAYCPNNNGFSLGFDYLGLTNISKTQEPLKFYLLPCFYKKEEQDDIVKELSVIPEILYYLAKKTPKTWNEISEDYTRKYLLISSILKDKPFFEEEEWRLCCFKQRTDNHI